MQLEEQLEPTSALPEHLFWIAVIERAVLDARMGGAHARSARAWLLGSPEFLTVAYRAGSDDAEALRAKIRRDLDQRARFSRSPRGPRLHRVTMLTAPPGLRMWEIVERTTQAARRV